VAAVLVALPVPVAPPRGSGRAHAIGHDVKDHLVRGLPGVVDVLVHVEPADRVDVPEA
jgi:hypothetical protein